MSMMEFFAQIILKATVLLAAAFAASLLLRRSGAALRHFVWAASLAALLLLPALTRMGPRWGWRTMPARATVVAVSQVRATVPAATALTDPRPAGIPPLWPAMLWAAGFLACAIHFLMGVRRTAQMLRKATPWSPPVDVPVLVRLSAEVPMPLVSGIRHPTIVLPSEACEWPAGRLRTVLLHELLHVERRDLLAQAVGQAACCFYWFHPLAWIAARQLRKERERACDDAVLLRGVDAPDYASHLVELVRSMAARQAQWSGAAGMAEQSDLESRVRELLDRKRRRHPLTRGAAAAVVAACFAVLLPLAAVTAYAQADRGGIAGVVQDPSGARLPQCDIIAKRMDGANQEVAHCNPAGEYRFTSIPPGRYAMEFRAPGFARQKLEIAVSGGTVARVDSNLTLGSVSETTTVTGQKPATVPLARTAPNNAQRIRVGGNVQFTRLLSKTDPVYPADAQQQGVEGSVLIEAVISKTGEVLNPRVTNTVDARLAKAALEAVSKWRYSPTLLNGEPVEVLTSVTVDFKLNP